MDEDEPGSTDDLTYERAVEVARPWGLEVRYCAETGSTNADAAAWAPLLATMTAPGAPWSSAPGSRKGPGSPEGPGARHGRAPVAVSLDAPAPPRRPIVGGLVVAGHQTAGRGRMDRSWFSVPGASLLFSLVVHPALGPSLLGLVPLAAGVALCRAARGEGVAARLKWPNDLVVEGRKAGGILCETAWRAGATAGAGPIGSAGWLVVGVGVNVNLPPDELPEDLRATATSLSTEAGRTIDRAGLLSSFLEGFLPLLQTLEVTGASPVLDAYLPLCDTVGMAVRADVAGFKIMGVATDIDPSGALVLDTGAVLTAGDIVHLVPSLPTSP
jgi:BirA family transcriptional regulator, biotin operon repressor / biotin---[acetyl-CoA-carboxylase] ligase